VAELAIAGGWRRDAGDWLLGCWIGCGVHGVGWHGVVLVGGWGEISDWIFQNVKCVISGVSRRFQVEGFRLKAKRLWV